MARARRCWRKLYLGVDADTGEIVAADLTSNDVDDGSQVGPLLDPVARPVASFTGEGAFDRDDVYSEVAERHPAAAVIVPPRSGAVLSDIWDPVMKIIDAFWPSSVHVGHGLDQSGRLIDLPAGGRRFPHHGPPAV